MIPNDDSDENPYTFTITGTGTPPEPEINVKQGAVDIPSSTGPFDFGTFVVNTSSVDIIFTIENLGGADLILISTPRIRISGANASLFAINQFTTLTLIPPGSSTTFTVTFTPTSLGNKIATISIRNNDTDESNYTFSVTGNCKSGDRIIYVVDRSGSMSSRYSPGYPVYDRNGNVVSYPNRWQGCQSDVAQAIDALNSWDSFDVISFETQIHICYGTLTDGTSSNKQQSIAWLYNQGVTG